MSSILIYLIYLFVYGAASEWCEGWSPHLGKRSHKQQETTTTTPSSSFLRNSSLPSFRATPTRQMPSPTQGFGILYLIASIAEGEAS